MVDTWAWLALNDKGDADYAIASVANDDLLENEHIFVTTNFILDETYTLLRRRVSAQQAIQFGHDILQAEESGALEIVSINKEIEKDAWGIFETYHQVNGLSYTDCTTFSAMKAMEITEVFSADEHFSMMGYIKYP